MSDPVYVPKMACTSCPYRRDTPSGVWDVEEYEKLRRYDDGHITKGPNGEDVRIPELSFFLCHQSNATGRPTACRGWLSVHADNVAVRLSVCMGAIRPEDVPTEPESIYYSSGNEAADAGLKQIKRPSSKAIKMMDRLLARGAGRVVE